MPPKRPNLKIPDYFGITYGPYNSRQSMMGMSSAPVSSSAAARNSRGTSTAARRSRGAAAAAAGSANGPGASDLPAGYSGAGRGRNRGRAGSQPASRGQRKRGRPVPNVSGGTLPYGADIPNYRAQQENLYDSDDDQEVGPGARTAKDKDQDPESKEGFVDEAGIEQAETYAKYAPSKLKIGKEHPDPVVETASMANVLPPDITYRLHLPQPTIEKGLLSALQLEAVTYACQQHENFLSSGERAGFLIGDGAGVGKGRMIAGIIMENYKCKRKKAIWVSVSGDLAFDAERDLRDIGAEHMPVIQLRKLPYKPIVQTKGVVFATYSSLIAESSKKRQSIHSRVHQLIQWCGPAFDGVIVFDESHRAKNLCPTKGMKPTKTGLKVELLQKSLPQARIVYASATGASEPRNMAYMCRLGIWGPNTPWKDVGAFVKSIDQRGVGAMELVAMDMKLRGSYLARQLSFEGVKFRVEEVPLSEEFHSLYDECVSLWIFMRTKFEIALEKLPLADASTKTNVSVMAVFWAAHQRFFKSLCISAKVDAAVRIARESIDQGKCVVIGLQSTGEARLNAELEKYNGILEDFYSTAKGIMEDLVAKHFPQVEDDEDDDDGPMLARNIPTISKRKMRDAAENASKRMKAFAEEESKHEASGVGKRARTTDADSKVQIEDFDSDSLTDGSETLSEHDDVSDDESVQAEPTSSNSRNEVSQVLAPDQSKALPSPEEIARELRQMKKLLMQKIRNIGDRLPSNTLDHLVDELGGTNAVAEMTGRKSRMVQNDYGEVAYESRADFDGMDAVNLREKQRFMDGEKKIAIISEAASSGISLQSDRRAKNTLPRVHITLELPWSADRAIQQFGRTHRSNQANLPEYVFLITDLAGERRFASVVAQRLESLGALTHGDRRASDSRDLSQFHIYTKYGRDALKVVLCSSRNKENEGTDEAIVDPPAGYNSHEEFFTALQPALVGVDLMKETGLNLDVFDPREKSKNMSRFLNRILGMPVKLQNELFQYFSDTLDFLVSKDKKTGRYDEGILDLGATSGTVEFISSFKFHVSHAAGDTYVALHELRVERGMTWEQAERKNDELVEPEEGFYVYDDPKSRTKVPCLVIYETVTRIADRVQDQRRKLFTMYRPNIGLQKLRAEWEDIQRFDKITPEAAKPLWIAVYEASATQCMHMVRYGRCKNHPNCEWGKRTQEHAVLSGSVLLVWPTVEKILKRRSIQVVRVRDKQVKIVGIIMHHALYAIFFNELANISEDFKEFNVYNEVTALRSAVMPAYSPSCSQENPLSQSQSSDVSDDFDTTHMRIRLKDAFKSEAAMKSESSSPSSMDRDTRRHYNPFASSDFIDNELERLYDDDDDDVKFIESKLSNYHYEDKMSGIDRLHGIKLESDKTTKAEPSDLQKPKSKVKGEECSLETDDDDGDFVFKADKTSSSSSHVSTKSSDLQEPELSFGHVRRSSSTSTSEASTIDIPRSDWKIDKHAFSPAKTTRSPKAKASTSKLAQLMPKDTSKLGEMRNQKTPLKTSAQRKSHADRFSGRRRIFDDLNESSSDDDIVVLN